MISLATTTYDSNGHTIIKDSSRTNIETRDYRLIKSQTLDGGTVFIHSGYAVGDREITVNSNITESQAETLKYIGDNYTSVTVSTEEGFFLGAIKKLNTNNGELEMTLYLKEKDN